LNAICETIINIKEYLPIFFKMHLPKHYYPWFFGLLTLILMSIAIVLGFWQISRGQARDLMRTELETVPTVSYSGRWLPEHTLYLENRTMQDRVGFYVITPLLIHGGQEVLGVLRGWVPKNPIDRTDLPPIQTSEDRVEISGILVPPPSMFLSLGEEDKTSPIRQNIDWRDYEDAIGLPLIAKSLRMTGNVEDGLLRDWDNQIPNSLKNYAYAAQWFFIALGILCIYLWYVWVRPKYHHGYP
jgi:surfeit locus 1 family protein